MVKVYSKALDQTIEVSRLIGSIRGSQPGPTLIFVGGMHGNEPSGVFALRHVLDDLAKTGVPLRGNVYAFSGNLWALARGRRFDRQDLNRLWTPERMQGLHRNGSGAAVPDEDSQEQAELYRQVRRVMETETGPFFFLDLHTTSSDTIPFITINDTLLNRRFALQYPVPIILGIEEYIHGPFLSYINELGYIAVGFEAGQHDDPAAIDIHVAFIYLTLVYTGLLRQTDLPAYTQYYQSLDRGPEHLRDIFEIRYRYEIRENESFTMQPGYANFKRIARNEVLATSNSRPVKARRDGRIFMPLYQNQGDDGFFIIRRTPAYALQLSAWLRKLKLDRTLPLLPGVRWRSPAREALLVDQRIARFLTKDFFHLLGYRTRETDQQHLVVHNRENQSKHREYRKRGWV